jgi:D-hydroxyproline dehydrogenase subunit beta
MSAQCPDVLIVGGGIVGAACAMECAESGLRVTVVEEDVIGGGATAAGMGHIVVMDDSESQFRLTHYSECLWHTLAPSLPADCEYLPCGTLWVAADEEEIAEVIRKHDYYAARGVATHILDAQSLAEAEPNLRRGLAGGLLVPGDGSVYSPAVARHLIERAQSRGARLLAGRRVAALTEGRAAFADGETIDAGAVVNATGTAAPQLTPGLEIQPRKGHLLITDRYPGFVRSQLVELGYLKSAHVLKSAHGVASDSVAFNVQPRLTGQLLIGSSRQFGEHDSAVEGHMLSRMLARAIRYIPGLEALSGLRAWTGFRAATPDKLPLIGPVPGFERLFVASGHEGLGITTSLGTAKLLVDAILHRPSAIPPEPYAASRSVAAHA